MKKTFRSILAGALALLTVSCYDDSALRKELSDLASRVADLENSLNKEVSTLNSKMDGLQAAYMLADKNLSDQLTGVSASLMSSINTLITRIDGIDGRIDGVLEALNNAIKAEPILQNHFYFVLYGEDRTNLEETAIGMMNDLGTGQYTIASNILKENDLVSFLKSNYQTIFAEQEIQNLAPSHYNSCSFLVKDWISPTISNF